MDLLRLVISRQTLEKLTALSKLLKSELFIGIRRSIVNTGRLDLPCDYIYKCVADGEILASRANTPFPGELMSLRAIFLHDATSLGQLNGSMDFWYALSTGNRQVQEVAFRRAGKRSQLLAEWNDLLDIPWNEWLTNRLRDFVDSGDGNVSARSRGRYEILRGFLGLSKGSFAANIGRILSRLRGQVVMERDEILDGILRDEASFDSSVNNNETIYWLIYSGYLFPTIYMARSNERWVREILNTAYDLACYDLLKLAAKEKWERFATAISVDTRVTQSLVGRVQRILADPEICRFIGQHSVGNYRILSGETMDQTGSIPREKCYNFLPGHHLSDSSISGSLQAAVIYDFRYCLEKHWSLSLSAVPRIV